jgi:hypothetical protein
MSYQIKDYSRFHTNNLFKLVFCRNATTKKLISFNRWLYITLFEILFGSELIENIINSSICPSNTAGSDTAAYGRKQKLNLHVPSGLFTNMFRKQLVEVLYYKYYLQYAILEPSHKPEVNEALNQIDCTDTYFSAFKEMFNQLIALRRVYDFSFLIFNLSIDMVVYLITDRIDLAIVTALILESVRRTIKI